ncbi:hypothetical protein CBR_g16091 [Chara braunii]|uniref:DUF659 domain-containing protein n=1 Tax=Chara braunii TaxID=69332 RepID=A0A388KTJ2_CHABU|nr:hypothetical protein CBR_g16091 [Chara braunii]|eukprot:GBG73377.1 hypothetical protein CBR_g16091 [Chara braunii]
MVHKLVFAGAKVLWSDKKTQYLLKNYRQLHGIAEGGTTATETQDADSEPLVCGYEELQPPTTAGMAPPKTASRKESVAAADEGLAEGSGSNMRVASLQQTSIKRWMDNDAQKKLDIAWAEAMFRVGIAFNFLNFDTTQKLHEVYLEVRPVMNFLAAGEKGAVLVATMSMTARKKTAQALAKLWEQIMREIGVHRINAICTDNAEVNKKAAQILERRTDKDIARIPWVPCAAHCCSLLLRDISKRDWVKSTVKRGHTIVKFIRNHHSTNSLMMSMDDSLTLLRPTEVRFGSVYMMLERLLNRKAVLSDMVDRKNAARWTGIRWSNAKVKSKADLVYFTMRRDGWWTELKKVVDVMEPAIAIKVMGMWSTATPTEKNWSSMDFVHSKRRNSLKAETLEKLVYIHWNMQLLRAANNNGANGEGYVDLWSSFFEAIPEPDENDGSVLRGPEEETEKTDKELVRQSSFVKTPKGRIPKKLEDEEDECTDESDLDDELWKGKCGLSDETSGAEEEDESDSDFELGAQPSVPGTTYVGRREPAGRRREKQPTVSTQARGEISSQYHPQSDVEFHHMDTDIELLLQSGPVDEDQAEADRAKALADRDRDAVQKRIMEEDAQRASIPTRREIERHKKKVGGKEPETRRALGTVQEGDEEEQQQSGPVLKVADQQEAEHRKEVDQQEAEHRKEAEEKDQQEDNDDMDHLQEAEKEHGEEDEEMEQQEDAEAMELQEDAEGMEQQDMQHNVDDEDSEEEHRPAVKTVYTRRQRPVVSAQSVENSPDFPPSNEAVQHDNLWVGRVGRKRKEPVEDAAAKPKRARGRPRKLKTAEPAQGSRGAGEDVFIRRHKDKQNKMFRSQLPGTSLGLQCRPEWKYTGTDTRAGKPLYKGPCTVCGRESTVPFKPVVNGQPPRCRNCLPLHLAIMGQGQMQSAVQVTLPSSTQAAIPVTMAAGMMTGQQSSLLMEGATSNHGVANQQQHHLTE